MNRKALSAFLAVMLATGSLPASVLIELAGGYLKNASGEKVPNGSGILVLVASTQDAAFTVPTSDTVLAVGKAVTAGSDDVILLVEPIAGDGNSNGTDDAGEFRRAVNIVLGAEVPAGCPLQLYWFPSLDSTATAAATGTAYGAYRADIEDGKTDADGGDAWFLPSDGTTGHGLLFLTADAGSLLNAGTSGALYGMPAFAVAQGDGSVPPDITVTTSTDSGTTPATPTPSPTATATPAPTPTASPTSTAFARKLAALKKQLARARLIKNPQRRKKKVAAIRARIKALIKAHQSAS